MSKPPAVSQADMIAAIEAELAGNGPSVSGDPQAPSIDGMVIAPPDINSVLAADPANIPGNPDLPGVPQVSGAEGPGVAVTPTSPSAPGYNPAHDVPAPRVDPTGVPMDSGDGGVHAVPTAPAPGTPDPALTPPTHPIPDASSPAPVAAPDPTVSDGTAPVEPSAPELDVARVWELALGHAPDVNEVIQTLDITTRLAALSEEDQSWVNGLLTGQVTAAQLNAAIEAASRAQSPQPTPQPTTPPPAASLDPWADPPATPAVDPQVEQLRAQLEAQQRELAAQQAQWRDQQLRAIQRDAEAGWNEWVGGHDLAPEETIALRTKVNQSPLFGALVERVGAKEAISQTIQHTVLNDEYFRARLLGDLSSSTPSASEVARQQAAAALASNGQGTGGVGPSAPPRPANPNTVAIPAGMVDPTQQQPVQPGTSPLAPPAADQSGLDLSNRNVQARAMTEMIAGMIGQS